MIRLLKHWRPIAAIALLLGAYAVGRYHQSRFCKADQLQSEVQSLEDQIEISRKVRDLAVHRSIDRQKETEALTAKVESYEDELENRSDPACLLSPADARRLQDIQ